MVGSVLTSMVCLPSVDIDLHDDLGLQPLHGYPPYEALVKPKE